MTHNHSALVCKKCGACLGICAGINGAPECEDPKPRKIVFGICVGICLKSTKLNQRLDLTNA